MEASLQDTQKGIYNFPVSVTKKGASMSEEYGLTVDTIAKKLAYDADTGIFTWIVPASRNVCAGSIAGCDKATRTGKGGEKVSYRYIRIDGASIPAAKLAWLLHYGEWPRARLGFHDGDTLNLRIANLYETNGMGSKANKFLSTDRKEYMKAHREAYPVEWKDTYLTQKYGIDMSAYIAMAIAQNNKCAICDQEETATRGGKTKALAVDHNHTTGKVRGLLCEACNQAIGKMKENRNILLSAIQYLDKHSEASPNVVSLESKG